MRRVLGGRQEPPSNQANRSQTNTTMPAPIVTVPADLWTELLEFVATFRADEVPVNLWIRANKVDVPDLSPEEEARRQKIVDLAVNMDWVADGQVEIDSDARLSEGNDNGCYVSGWVWCDYTGTEFDKACSGCAEVFDDPDDLTENEDGRFCADCLGKEEDED